MNNGLDIAIRVIPKDDSCSKYLDDIFQLLIAGQKASTALRNNGKALILYASQHDSRHLPLCKRIHISGQFVVMQEIWGPKL